MKKREECGKYYHWLFADELDRNGSLVVRATIVSDVRQEFAERGYILHGGAAIERDGEIFKVMYI